VEYPSRGLEQPGFLMPQVMTPLLGGTYQSRSLLLNAQRCINLYPELVETKDGKEVGAFYGCPGLLPLMDSGEDGAWRALHVMGNGTLVGVFKHHFYQISGVFSLTSYGGLATSVGPVGIVDNGTKALIVDGVNAYGFDSVSNVFKVISLPFLSGFPVVCAYQDGFFLLNQTGTQKWWQSDLNDVFTWNGLDFSTKDGQPDPIVTMIDNHREVWLFGSRTTEIWINAGNPGFAFARLQGVFIQEGCCAPYSARIAGSTVIWLSSSKEGQGVVLQAVGYAPRRISTHAIEREIQSYQRIDDAIAYVYQQEGHQFYVLTFPSADATWVYDLTTGLWHERADFRDGLFHRHRSNCYAFFKGRNIVGDYANGNLYEFDLNTYTDNGDKRKWLRSWPAQPTGQLTLRKNRFNRLQLYMEPAVSEGSTVDVRVLQDSDEHVRTLVQEDRIRVLSGISNDDEENGKVMLRWSDTGGLNFGNEHWTTVGKVGEVKHRVIWRRLGSGRDRIFEVSGTDPYKVALVGAILDVEAGIS
jgi:hypothetical protein